MIRIVRKSLSRFMQSSFSYIMLAFLVIFWGMNTVSSHQSAFSSAQDIWDNMSSTEQYMYIKTLGSDDSSQVVAYLQETYFCVAFSPHIWLIICATLSIILFVPEKKAKHFSKSLIAGHSRKNIVAAHYVLYTVIILPFSFVITLLYLWIFNSSWSTFPVLYILRNYAMFVLMLLHYSSFFTLLALCIPSAAATTIATVGICGLVVIVANMKNDILILILGVIFPFLKNNQTNIWAMSLCPSHELNALCTSAYALLTMIMFYTTTQIVLSKRDFA